MEALAAVLDDLRHVSAAVGVATVPPKPTRLPAGLRLAAAVALVLTASLIYTSLRQRDGAGVAPRGPAPRQTATTGNVVERKAMVYLAENSATRFIPVPRASSNPKIHLYLLYEKSGAGRARRAE